MMIVAEGDERGGARVLDDQLQKAGCPFSTRVVVLGHLQRGGAPCPDDRILASQMGELAARAIDQGQSRVMAGIVGGQALLTPLESTYASHKPISPQLLSLVAVLST